jgi:hypothetical protein
MWKFASEFNCAVHRSRLKCGKKRDWRQMTEVDPNSLAAEEMPTWR